MAGQRAVTPIVRALADALEYYGDQPVDPWEFAGYVLESFDPSRSDFNVAMVYSLVTAAKMRKERTG